MINIENLSGRVLVFNLTTKIAPLRREYLTRTVDRDGKVTAGARRVVHPDSLTICAGASLVVPDSFQSAPEIQKALKAGKVRISDAQAEPEPDAEAPASDGDAPAAPRTRRSK